MQLSFPSSLFAITVDTYLSLFSYFFVMQHAGIELGPHRYDATLLTSTLAGHKPRIVYTTIITRVRAGEVGGAHYPKWRRSLLIRAET